MATGNRVSELANFSRTGLGKIDPNQSVKLCVLPGFIYKNQRLNRTPPNVEVLPMPEEPFSICPVRNLLTYLQVSPAVRGPLFLNSKTGVKLHPLSISILLCDVIEEAYPGSLPQGHDVRRVASSIAWTRGLDPADIAKRVFWRSTNVFINRYLSNRASIGSGS